VNAGVRVLVQRQPVDESFVTQLVDEECAVLGDAATVSWLDDETNLVAAIGGLRADEPAVVVPAPGTPDLGDLPVALPGPSIRVDIDLRDDPDRTACLRRHIQGRGVDGIRWALRTLHHLARRPVHVVPYGTDPDQFGELRLADLSGRPQPVVVVLHGGFWRSRWQEDLMDALCVDLAERGLASWNVEYRRPDRHQWSDTVCDVRAAIEHVRELAIEYPVDPHRIALVGHSAGGQLAVQAAAGLVTAADQPRPALVVQLAGLVDLEGTHRRDLGNGAVPTALGGTPEEVPGVYEKSSPLSRLPVGARQLVVIGRSDSPDLREMSRRYVTASAAAGDDATLVEDDGDHFSVIDPTSPLWARTAEALHETLSL
jgi:acetyl esterase/lipase